MGRRPRVGLPSRQLRPAQSSPASEQKEPTPGVQTKGGSLSYPSPSSHRRLLGTPSGHTCRQLWCSWMSSLTCGGVRSRGMPWLPFGHLACQDQTPTPTHTYAAQPATISLTCKPDRHRERNKGGYFFLKKKKIRIQRLRVQKLIECAFFCVRPLLALFPDILDFKNLSLAPCTKTSRMS